MTDSNEPPHPDVQPFNFMLKAVTGILLLAAAFISFVLWISIGLGLRSDVAFGTAYLSITLAAAFFCEWIRRRFVRYRPTQNRPLRKSN
jgi:hypothetical protein